MSLYRNNSLFYPSEPLNPKHLIDTINYRKEFYATHPFYFRPEGIICFCGAQSEGKTLSAVQYVINVLQSYPLAILCTNVKLTDYPFNATLIKDDDGSKKLVTAHVVHRHGYDEVVPDEYFGEISQSSIEKGQHSRVVVDYMGLDSLLNIHNGQNGVIFFIDEIHLELNSMESKNIDMDYFIELSQSRKQRTLIVGTSQKYMRMAKPLREQCHYVVNCREIFHLVQLNQLIDNAESVEVDGKLKCKVLKNIVFFHSSEMYNAYDTYQKMQRYKNEWKEHKRDSVVVLGG